MQSIAEIPYSLVSHYVALAFMTEVAFDTKELKPIVADTTICPGDVLCQSFEMGTAPSVPLSTWLGWPRELFDNIVHCDDFEVVLLSSDTDMYKAVAGPFALPVLPVITLKQSLRTGFLLGNPNPAQTFAPFKQTYLQQRASSLPGLRAIQAAIISVYMTRPS